MDWQQQAQAFLSENRYEEAIALYEEAIEAEPEVVTHYLYLGLAYLLQGMEEEAQATWLFVMSQGATEEIEAWTQELVEILDREANRQQSLFNWQNSYLIRQHIREFEPENINNLLYLLELAIDTGNFNNELFKDWKLIENLSKTHFHSVNWQLLVRNFAKINEHYNQYLNNVLNNRDYFAYHAQQHGKTLQNLYPEIPLTDDPVYYRWLLKNYPNKNSLANMAEAVEKLNYKPVISVIVPVFNTSEVFLRAAIESVFKQVYPNWQLCIADDASTLPHIKLVLEEYLAKDQRIKVAWREENGHISRCSNSALEIATGEFIALLDHDDILAPHALYEAATVLNENPDLDMIYSDEDHINESGKNCMPYFKPDWCPDTFLSWMYVCHLGIYRRSIVNDIGGFKSEYDGTQDYDFVLRFTEKTTKIHHIPKILYHWRKHSTSVSSSIRDIEHRLCKIGKQAIEEAIARRGEKGEALEIAELPGVYNIRYVTNKPKLVSIIIPTRNLGDILHQCLESIFQKTTCPNYEVIVIDNGSNEENTLKIFFEWKEREPNRFKCYPLDIPFNFSKINNYAAEKAEGEYLLFLNNDTEVIHSDWLEAMVEQAQRPSIGAVGALLLYPDKSIQHAGVVVDRDGGIHHIYKLFPEENYKYIRDVRAIKNYIAVTGACLMCRREVFESVGGFEEDLAVALNDIDLCLKFVDKGYFNIYLPHVALYHHESKSRGAEDTPEKMERYKREKLYLMNKWQKFFNNDPCHSYNFKSLFDESKI